MADVFNINWVDRMKTDPRANSILNNKTKFENFAIWRFTFPAGVTTVRNARRYKHKKSKLRSDRWSLDYRALGNPRHPGVYRYDPAWYPYRISVENNPQKYYENTIGRPLYTKHSIANAPNPHIEKLAYKD